MTVILLLLSLLVFFIPVRFKGWFALAVVSAGALIYSIEAVKILLSSLRSFEYEGSYNFMFGQWDVPVVDSLSAVFILVISLVSVSVILYSRGYVDRFIGKKSSAQISIHYLALCAIYFSMIGAVVFRGGFSFLFSWELMTVSTFALMLFNGQVREVRRAAINYLVLMHVGFVLLTVGFVTGGQGSIGGFDSLPEYFGEHNPIPLFLVFLAGFGMKAGLFPLYVWLPEAHADVPAHVSSIMSGAVKKIGVYGVLRVLTHIHTDIYVISIVVISAGLITALWGIVQAALSNDLKKLLAYSSIENIGIIFTGIGAGLMGIATGNDTIALLCFAGALLHVVNHSMFKPLLFMCAGAIYTSAGTMNMDELGGVARRMPITAVLFFVGSVAICALPPLNGFVSEYLIYLGLFDSVASGSNVLVSVIAAGVLALVGGLALLAFTKAFGITFLGSARCCKADNAEEPDKRRLIAQVIPLAGVIAIGVFPMFFADVTAQSVAEAFNISVYTSSLTVPAGGLSDITMVALSLIAVVAAIYVLKTRMLKARTITEGPTWGCGFTAPNKRMQYTGGSYSEGLKNLGSGFAGKPAQEGRESGGVFAGEEGLRSPDKEKGDRVDRFVSRIWSYLMHRLNTGMSFFQDGKINHYVLYALLFLVLIFILTLTGVI